MKHVEYRVRPVTRYIVTRWHQETDENGRSSGGCDEFGEFANHSIATRVTEALVKSEYAKETPLVRGEDSFGWTIGGEPAEPAIVRT